MARADLDILLRNFVGRAQQELDKTGAFYPFAAVIDTTGQGKMVEYEGGDDHPEPGDVSRQLTDVLKIKIATGKIRAAGMCMDLTVSLPDTTEPTDAIAAFLEDNEGEAVAVYVPYKKAEGDTAVEYGEVIGMPAPPQFFTKTSSN